MAKQWDDIGDGKWKLTVSPDGGGPASIFYGTRDEILDKLADSQANANGVLEQNRRERNSNGNGHPAPNFQPKPLTPNERMQTVADLTNPAQVVEGVTRVVESVIGPVDAIPQERLGRAQEAAALAFYEEMEPNGWHASQYNKVKLLRHMISQGFDLTQVADWKRAYAELAGAKLLEEKPAETQDFDEVEDGLHRRNAENPAPKTPTRYSTGVRQSDISGTPPMPSKRLKYSKEQIRDMSASTYKRLMLSDPEFSRCVEFHARTQQKRRVAVG